jgi:hypothetical protein
MLILDVRRGAVDVGELTRAQADAAKGVFVSGMSGFVRYIAGRYEDSLRTLPERVAYYRERAAKEGRHRRVSATIAKEAEAWDLWLDFTQEAGVLDATEAETLRQRVWKALRETAAAQEKFQEQSDPVTKFIAVLRAAIVSGKAHLADKEGNAQDNPVAWGWHHYGPEDWRPQGDVRGARWPFRPIEIQR